MQGQALGRLKFARQLQQLGQLQQQLQQLLQNGKPRLLMFLDALLVRSRTCRKPRTRRSLPRRVDLRRQLQQLRQWLQQLRRQWLQQLQRQVRLSLCNRRRRPHSPRRVSHLLGQRCPTQLLGRNQGFRLRQVKLHQHRRAFSRRIRLSRLHQLPQRRRQNHRLLRRGRRGPQRHPSTMREGRRRRAPLSLPASRRAA